MKEDIFQTIIVLGIFLLIGYYLGVNESQKTDDCNVVPFVVQKEITNNYTCECPVVDCTKEVRQMIDDVKVLKGELE